MLKYVNVHGSDFYMSEITGALDVQKSIVGLLHIYRI